MTKYQILLTLYGCLSKELDKDGEKSEEFRDYLSRVNPYVCSDGKTADPAYYADFLEIADSLFEEDECTAEEGYVYAKRYLDELNRWEHDDYDSNIDEVVAVFSECTLGDWNAVAAKLRENKTRKRRCACCGYYTLIEAEGGYEICPVCFWEDDRSQNDDPDLAGGANKVCLREAQRNFEEFGACTENSLPFVREPDAEEISGIVRELSDEE